MAIFPGETEHQTEQIQQGFRKLRVISTILLLVRIALKMIRMVNTAIFLSAHRFSQSKHQEAYKAVIDPGSI